MAPSGISGFDDDAACAAQAPRQATAQPSARDDLLEQLNAHVREVVRREGVDPQAGAGVVRRIAESVVRDHDERSLTGVVVSVPDVESVVGELVARVSRLGLLQPFLDDPRCNGRGQGPGRAVALVEPSAWPGLNAVVVGATESDTTT